MAHCNCVIDCGVMVVMVVVVVARPLEYVCVDCADVCPPSYCFAQAVVDGYDVDAVDGDEVSVPVVAAESVDSCAPANRARTFPAASTASAPAAGAVAAVVAAVPATCCSNSRICLRVHRPATFDGLSMRFLWISMRWSWLWQMSQRLAHCTRYSQRCGAHAKAYE